MQLAKGKKQAVSPGREKVTCKCGRIFIYDINKTTYRRALFEEA